tara:strand:+ start:6485 stop:7240 length:756 start_codon:yes stop_codon:yes gene_type:complete
MQKFKNKVAFITGGASGIGKASAIAIAKEGAKVVIVDLEQSQHEAALNEIKQAGDGDALFIPVDVSDAEQVKKAIATTVETYGTLDIALNNAGIAATGVSFVEDTPESFEKVMQVNLNGIANGMRYQIAQFLKQGGGVIVNMGSALGLIAQQNNSAYISSKHGIHGLTKAAAVEYGKQNIRINAIAPGYINSPLLEQHFSAEQMDNVISQHPIGRLGSPEEIANAFLFLASDDASFITATILSVDGGLIAW